MKRIGYVLLCAVALLVIFTIALAQLETKSAKYLLKVLTGEDVRGYYGTDVETAYAYSGGTLLFAVSASGEGGGPTRSGKVFFYDKVLADKPVLTITGPNEGEVFGWALSGGGDFNGDGKPDLAVGAPGQGVQPGVKGTTGKVYLYLGDSDFGKATPAVASSGEAGDGFGEAVCLKYDVNGDSLADLVVGAPRSAKGGATSGRAYVWFGKRSGELSKAPDVEIRLGTTNDLFGTAVAEGDVTGDGIADVIIGAPHANVGDQTPGLVYIFNGGKRITFGTATTILKGEGTSFQDEFGRSLAVVPDLNGDKIADLVIGAPQVVIGGKQMGRVYVFHGAAKMGPPAAQTFDGTSEAGKFGNKVFEIGDVNADGEGDWAVQAESESSARGVAHFYYGGWDKEFYRFTGENVGDRAGHSVAALGALEGKAPNKVIVGARWNHAGADYAGRAYILGFE
jgi:hypothetical protein